ncbi:hypothetical protein [Moraxella lacunata]|uniref:hypothetical protein n=1 Tax=Moraxella lacunata TaxID=477 RepID=UPI003EE37A09
MDNGQKSATFAPTTSQVGAMARANIHRPCRFGLGWIDGKILYMIIIYYIRHVLSHIGCLLKSIVLKIKNNLLKNYTL